MAALVGLFALALAAQGQAAPPVLWQECETGTAAGECRQPRGITADPSNGHIYASDQENRRIVKFDAWGQFLRAWGWDVVASGPGNKSTAPEPPQLEVCVPAEGDVCKAGVQGTGGAGQFNQSAGLAVDSAGDVFAAEAGTPRRVQKFSPEGEFLLSFGGGVNQGGGTPANPGNVCTAQHLANGDVCGAGQTGTGPGEFSGATSPLRTVIAIGPEDEVYVGDANRIQRFNTGGVYQDEIAVPGEGVQQLAVDDDGFLYASYEVSSVFPQANEAKPNIRKLDPVSGNEILVFEIPNPRAIAVAPNGDVYGFKKETGLGANPRIWRFDSSGAKIEEFGEGLSIDSTGLAVNDVACGGEEIAIYHANNNPSFIRAHSPTPDPECVGDPPAVPPQVSDTHALSVGAAGATVRAKINPRFWPDTTYFVQYGSAECIAGGWESACVAEQPAPPGILLTDEVSGTDLPTEPISLAGLAPGTTYHYRFVAQSGGGGPVYGEERTLRTHRMPTPAAPCANDAFRSGAAASLPDCRAYEMVSPVDKDGGDIVTLPNNPDFPARHDQSAATAGKLTFTAAQAFADPESAPYVSQYLATRKAGEAWGAHSISPPREGQLIYPTVGLDTQFKAFSADLSLGWLMTDSEPILAPGAIAGFGNLYRRTNATGAYQPQCSVAPPSTSANQFFPEVQGFSADGASTVFRANDKLTPNAASSGDFQLYECTATGQLRLVSVLPGGSPSSANSSAGTSLAGNAPFGPETGPWIGHRINTVHSAVSADGSRIYWSQSSINPGPLYVRIGGAETVEVSAAPAHFRGAAADGSRAIYTAGGTLFEFDLASKESTPLAAGLRGVMGVSEDASHVYFVSNEELGGEAGPEAGQPNLYHYEAGEGISFIAILSAEDAREGTPAGNKNPVLSPVNVHSIRRSSRVTPDGRHLAFMSSASLTGYDNTDRASGEANAEVFHYSAETGKLICASCNPTGARSAGADIALGSDGPLWASARIPGWENQHHASRVLSDDGKRLYFESFEALVLGDNNQAKDVYQWEALGKGSCAADSPTFSPASGGCLGLISSGKSPDDSEFVDASADGADIFFKTTQSLLAQDPGQIDIYTAREDGGLPSPIPPAPPCEGEACQSPPAPPIPQTPSSSAFAGPGDPPVLRDCRAVARRAKQLSNRARRAARNARRVSAPRRTRALRRQAKRLRSQAKRTSNNAKRCRVANRRARR